MVIRNLTLAVFNIQSYTIEFGLYDRENNTTIELWEKSKITNEIQHDKAQLSAPGPFHSRTSHMPNFPDADSGCNLVKISFKSIDDDFIELFQADKTEKSPAGVVWIKVKGDQLLPANELAQDKTGVESLASNGHDHDHKTEIKPKS